MNPAAIVFYLNAGMGYPCTGHVSPSEWCLVVATEFTFKEALGPELPTGSARKK